MLELPKSEIATTPILDSLTLEDRDSLARLLPSEAKKEDASLEARIVAKIYTFLDKTSDGFRSCRLCMEDLNDPNRSLNGEVGLIHSFTGDVGAGISGETASHANGVISVARKPA